MLLHFQYLGTTMIVGPQEQVRKIHTNFDCIPLSASETRTVSENKNFCVL